jgi:16S rRNA (cytosine967-C5)-methyltransferase
VPAVSPARKAAFDILLAVERGQAHADDLLRAKSVDALSPADRNLTTALVLGLLRWQIRLDAEINHFLKKPGAKLDAEVRLALRLGAFQLLYLDRVPAHAAIDESVELTKQAGHKFASGMVNAVLRKVAKALAPPPTIEIVELTTAGAEVAAAHAPAKAHRAPDVVTELALEYAHPKWMVERWVVNFGMNAARAICAHGQSQAALSVRTENPDVERELQQAGIVLEPGSLLSAAHTVISGDVLGTAAFKQGRARIQDEGSQLIGELAACAPGANRSAEKILDACAAPGGKTLILAERNPRAHILACESSQQRFAAMTERLTVLGQRVECRLADIRVIEEESAFDLVLADVPCSGTGTLGRNPEIRHRLRVEDLARHAERQRSILSRALRTVRPGGYVVYSTCSLEPEENEQVVAAVLSETHGARQVSLASRIESTWRAGILTASAAERLQAGLTKQGALQLLPGSFPTDGFFVALIEKVTENM